MRRRNDCNIRILTSLIIIVLLFIWGNSALPSESSNAISDSVTSKVGGAITHDDVQEKNSTTWLTSGHIRKLAHVAEFAVLGAILVLLVVQKKKKLMQQLPSIALFGLLVALLDETIQLFNDRTAAIKDVWIDFGGLCAGVLIVYCLRRAR